MHKHGCSNSELRSRSKVLPMGSQMGGHGRRPGESSLCLIDPFSVRFMVDANLNLAGSSTAVFLLHKLPKLSIIDEFIMRVLIRPTQTSCLEGYQGRLGEEFSMTWDSAPNTEIELQQRSTYTLSFAKQQARFDGFTRGGKKGVNQVAQTQVAHLSVG